MSETREPLEIVDGAFTVPKRGIYCAVAASTCVPPLGDLTITAMQGVASVTVAAADVPRFLEALAQLTGNGTAIEAARRVALDQAAREVDCDCPGKDAVLAAKTKSDRWRACGEGFCGALMARDIRALAGEE